MFIFVASLKGIDPSLYEAAVIDGANEFKKTIFITIPLLKNALAIAVLTTSMRVLATFEIPYILTRGGPNHATEFLATWAFNQGFSYNNVGYGSTISISLVVFSFILGFFLLRFWSIETAAQE